MPKTPPYSEQFKRDAVELYWSSDRSLQRLADELGIARSSLAAWVKQADADAGRSDDLTTDERAELKRLRREVRVLQEEREILKKAAAFFAKDSDNRR